MATAQEIIEGALRKLGIIAGNEEPSADDAAAGLTSLNDMCNSWAAKDVFSGFSSLTSTDDEFILDDRHHGAAKALLAEYIAPEYGADVPPAVHKQAYDGWLAIRADYRPIETLQVDTGLQAMPSQRIYW